METTEFFKLLPGQRFFYLNSEYVKLADNDFRDKYSEITAIRLDCGSGAFFSNDTQVYYIMRSY